MRSQFYRVEVKVLPPEEAAAPRSRSVLRRFSHFQKLYSIVRPCRPPFGLLGYCRPLPSIKLAELSGHTALRGHTTRGW